MRIARFMQMSQYSIDKSQLLDIYTDRHVTDRIRLTSETPFTPKYVKDNVTRVSDPTQVYASRVHGRQLLLDNPSRESRAKKEREAKKARRSSRKAGVVGSTEAKGKDVWKLTNTKFNSFLPLHHLWLDYMGELLNLSRAPSSSAIPIDDIATPAVAGMHAKLVKADLHGAIITVRQSKNPCLVGLSGIVIHEIENAFKIITKSDALKLIPKSHSIFVLQVPLFAVSSYEEQRSSDDSTRMASAHSESRPRRIVHDMPHIEFDLYGNQFCFRSAERASRKYKHKETVEL